MLRKLSIVFFLVLTLTTLLAGICFADPLTISAFSLPDEASPICGVCYYKGFVYTASMTTGCIYATNVTSGVTDTYKFSKVQYDRVYIGMAIDEYGNIWVCRLNTNTNGAIGGISKIELPDKETFVVNSTEENPTDWSGITYSNGFVYAAEYQWLYRVNVVTNTVERFTLPEKGVCFPGITADNKGVIWFADWRNGYLYSFDSSTEYVTMVKGFNNPRGVTVYNDVVYVAEGIRPSDTQGGLLSPAIAQYDIAKDLVTRTNVTGVPFAVLVAQSEFGPYLIYSSTGEDLTEPEQTSDISILDGFSYDSGKRSINYMSMDDSGNLYFGYSGSCGIAKMSGWKSPHKALLEKHRK